MFYGLGSFTAPAAIVLAVLLWRGAFCLCRLSLQLPVPDWLNGH